MGVSVNVDLSGVKAKLSTQAVNRGRYAMANQMLSDMTPFVPRKEGSLRSTGSVDAQGESLSWHTQYGKAQFYGTNGKATFKKYSTPGTGKRWDLKAKGIYMDAWKREFLKGAGL
ncbi:minor capsid protein [Enterococcus italicus]